MLSGTSKTSISDASYDTGRSTVYLVSRSLSIEPDPEIWPSTLHLSDLATKALPALYESTQTQYPPPPTLDLTDTATSSDKTNDYSIACTNSTSAGGSNLPGPTTVSVTEVVTESCEVSLDSAPASEAPVTDTITSTTTTHGCTTTEKTSSTAAAVTQPTDEPAKGSRPGRFMWSVYGVLLVYAILHTGLGSMP